jgi:radical SAM superfamily enzyme YgiQ (UPF0313 family)
MNSPQSVHPLGSKAKVLLCSVFGPYARDDEYGSRASNPMELWHNQVTRMQGPFSFREFHRSWGLMLIQANLSARCTCLDFPTLDRFVRELRDNRYDIVGISAIQPNLPKVQEMCRLIRRHCPGATIVVGGHIANLGGISERIDADHIVRGEGVRWFRAFLGEDTQRPLRHPVLWGGYKHRAMGVDLPFNSHNTSATILPSVGCPIGCSFCATSAMFGGKGKFVPLFPTAKELFAVMCQIEEKLKVCAFFILDENFLLQRPRALELLELMRKHDKAWALYVFSSANAIGMYSMEELVGLGVSWVWMGLEGRGSAYGKLHGTDTVEMVARLQDHGIRVLGSSIIGLEEHTPENIDEAIAYSVSHQTDFHQFMLYTPVAGTPLHAEHMASGTMLGPDEIAIEDTHGQYRFNFRHPHIRDGQEGQYLQRAFEEDYRVNGPSVLRIVRTALKGWQRYRNHPEARIRRRFAWEAAGLSTSYAGAVWGARKWFKDSPSLERKMDELLRDLHKEFGLVARLAAPVLGRYVYWKLRSEARRLNSGWTYEPPTFYERNYKETAPGPKATLLQWVPGLDRETASAAAPAPLPRAGAAVL